MTTLIPKFDLKDGSSIPTGAINRPINLKLEETISVQDFGATGDGVTDDTAAIQAAFDAIYTNANGFNDVYASQGKLKALYFPKGNYKITSTVYFGSSTKYITGGGIIFAPDAIIMAENTDPASFGMVIRNIIQGYFENIQIRNIVGGSALRLTCISDTIFNRLMAGATGTYCLKLSSLHYNVQYLNVGVGQHATVNGAEYGIYYNNEADDGIVGLAGMVICNFTNIGCSATTNNFWFEQNGPSPDGWISGQVSFDTVDTEGVSVPGGTNFVVKNFARAVKISNVWSETEGIFQFINCENILFENSSLTNGQQPGMFFENCGLVTLINCIIANRPVFTGTTKYLTYNSCLLQSYSAREIIANNQGSVENVSFINSRAIQQQNTYNLPSVPTYSAGVIYIYVMGTRANIAGLNTLITYVDTLGATQTVRAFGQYPSTYNVSTSNMEIPFSLANYASGFSMVAYTDYGNSSYPYEPILFNSEISTGTLQNDVRATDPRGVLTAQHYCTIVDSGSWTNISPLNMKESLLTITNASSYPYINVPFDGSAIPTDVYEWVLVTTCFRTSPNPSDSTAIALPFNTIEMDGFGPSPSETCLYSSAYGEYNYYVFRNGVQYTVCQTFVQVTHTTTNITIVFKYNASFPIGNYAVYGGTVISLSPNYVKIN